MNPGSRSNNSTSKVALYGLAALLLFGLCYPSHFLIGDEVAYFEQGYAWAQGLMLLPRAQPCSGSAIPWQPCDYPAGTALLAAFWIKLGGTKAVFWSGITTWLCGIGALALLLQRLGKALVWASYPAMFLPGLVLTRTVMSDLAGFALASLFLLFFSGFPGRRWSMAAAGFVAGAGLLFRETNLLWALPFLLGAAGRRMPGLGWLWGGFIGAAALRPLSSAVIFNNPWYLRDPGIAFSGQAFPQNLVFLLACLIVLLPGGLWFWWKNKAFFRIEIRVVVCLFLLLYAGYDYDAFAKSGIKGIVLQGRFLLPLLPVITLSAAHALENPGRHLRRVIGLMAVCSFAGVQVVGALYNGYQAKIAQALCAIPTQMHLSLTPDETKKYLNDLHGPIRYFPVAALQPGMLACDSVWYLHAITRAETADHRYKTALVEQALRAFAPQSSLKLLTDRTIPDGTRLRIWKLHLPPNPRTSNLRTLEPSNLQTSSSWKNPLKSTSPATRVWSVLPSCANSRRKATPILPCAAPANSTCAARMRSRNSFAANAPNTYSWPLPK